jgi:predicted NAD-dependent protein-ADP-ribosyltransferase YbiA (DUF1768 family)
MYAVQKHVSEKLGSKAAFKSSPLAYTSNLFAELDGVMRNNVLVFDSEVQSKPHLRKLRRPEIAVLLARAVSTLGHKQTLYWDRRRDKIPIHANLGLLEPEK